MAKSKKTIGGPFIAAAVFCNSVQEDNDGVLSALRIVDEIRLPLRADVPPDFPSKEKPLELTLFALISIRRGDSPVRKQKLLLAIENPEGTVKPLLKQDIELPPNPNGTFTVRARLAMKLHNPGTYWVDVILGKDLLTRMALNLVILREGTQTETPPGRKT